MEDESKLQADLWKESWNSAGEPEYTCVCVSEHVEPLHLSWEAKNSCDLISFNSYHLNDKKKLTIEN